MCKKTIYFINFKNFVLKCVIFIIDHAFKSVAALIFLFNLFKRKYASHILVRFNPFYGICFLSVLFCLLQTF